MLESITRVEYMHLHDKTVIYAINLSVTWTITHTKYDKAAIYAINLSVIWTITRRHLYGSTVISTNHVRNIVNLMLEPHVRYLLYIVIYCKRVHYNADSLMWGSLRLAPMIKCRNKYSYHSSKGLNSQAISMANSIIESDSLVELLNQFSE